MLGKADEGESGIAVIFKSFSLNDVLIDKILYRVLVVRPRRACRSGIGSYQIGDKVSLLLWHLLEYFKNLVTDDFFRLVNMGGGVI